VAGRKTVTSLVNMLKAKQILIIAIIFLCGCPLILTAEEQNAPDNTTQAISTQEQDLQAPHEIKMSPEELFNQKVSLDLRNIDVLEALKFVSTKGSLNIVSTKNVGGRVTLTLENVPLKDVFDIILRSNGLAYVKKGDIYQVMTEAEYKTIYGTNFSDIRQVKMLRLKYAIPEQAFSLLDALKSEVGRVLVDQESGNVLVMDTPEKMIQMEKALEEFERKNVVEVFVLKYAKAKEVEEMLRSRLELKKVGSVKADERNNQVVVQTLSERMEEVRQLINILDKPTKEVLIETKIVKIKLTNQMDTGIEWEGLFAAGKNAYVGSTPSSRITSGVTNPTFMSRSDWLEQQGGEVASSYPFSGTSSSLSSSTKVSPGERLNFGFIDDAIDFDVLAKVLNTIGQSRVLANPKIVVVNNQEAKIHIGERQAYVTTTTTSGTSTSTVAEEVTFVDVGIQLSVTPVINDDGYITMKIRPEISSVGSTLTTPTGNKIPIIDTSLTETTVMMKDNTTLLIGGLRREEKTKDAEQVPLLGNIPFLGNIFKKATNKTDRTELLVMITPHIISGVNFTTGNERAFGEKAGKEYKDYQPIIPDNKMLPGGIPPSAQPKTYRDYMGSKDDGEEELLAKGKKYELD
jgi:type IV pilus assembly protein PilQ